MRELFEQWRAEAKKLQERPLPSRSNEHVAATLERCANELEKQHHEESHYDAWNTDCILCMKEMSEENFVEPKDRHEAAMRLQDLLLRNGAQIREPTL